MNIAKIDIPPALGALLPVQLDRLHHRLRELAPDLSAGFIPWSDGLAGDRPPEEYFTHPYAFPTLLLPWWLDQALDGLVDEAFQADLIYSSLCGYYLIRLIDDVMDGGDTPATRLLPAVCVLHAEFQSTYAARFGSDHPFWSHFHLAWAQCQQAAYADGIVVEIDAETFSRICAQKVSAATIPMLAVIYRHGCESLPADWSRLFSFHCQWHQFHNDLFDWKRDQDRGIQTYFLREAVRRKRDGESPTGWVVREGFDWGIAQLEEWMVEMRALAAEMGSPALEQYLEFRSSLLRQVADEARSGLRLLQLLMQAGSA